MEEKLNKYMVSVGKYTYRDIPIIVLANEKQLMYLFFYKDWYSQTIKLSSPPTLKEAKEAFENLDIGFDTVYGSVKKLIDRLKNGK